MATEIERRFLVNPDAIPTNMLITHSNHIVQGYIAQEGSTVVRVRIYDDDNAEICIKMGSGMVRKEYEYDMTLNEAYDLIENVPIVSKRRKTIPYAEFNIELDIFEDHLSGLVIAEVEMSSEDDVFNPPAWFGTEVTNDLRYTNVALSKMTAEEVESLLNAT